MSYLHAIFMLAMFIKIKAVPPEACFANFRSEDCGRPPVKVLYYWKPGSRCEVGVWRGCFPNMNMFKDEYECVATCIFTARAESSDYHALKEPDITVSTTTFENETITSEADIFNATESNVSRLDSNVDNPTSQLNEGNTTNDLSQTTTGNSSTPSTDTNTV